MEDLYQEQRNFQKTKYRNNAIQMEKNNSLYQSIQCKNANVLDLMYIENDKALLISKRQKGRSLFDVDQTIIKKN